MKERPILFSAPMVRAILEGRKTMTRRVVKGVNPEYRFDGYITEGPRGYAGKCVWSPKTNFKYCTTGGTKVRCPYGQPGDRLWVRETWRVGAWNEDENQIAVDYKADGCCRREWLAVDDIELFVRLWNQSTNDAISAIGQRENYEWVPGASPCRWRPSIYMPRGASRILLEVTAVRVERLQDIDDADAQAEGVEIDDSALDRDVIDFVPSFQRLWDSINASRGYGWEKNPWVWVVEFKRVEV